MAMTERSGQIEEVEKLKRLSLEPKNLNKRSIIILCQDEEEE